MDESFINENTIYSTIAGSRSFGTSLSNSDTDVKGICIIPDINYYYGLKKFDQKDSGFSDYKDKVITDIRKFCILASTCNPSVLETLYTDESDILKMDKYGKKLRENRDLFLSKKARHTFSGYAVSMIKKLEAHKRWSENKIEKPERKDFEHDKTFVVGPLGSQLPDGVKIKSIREMVPNDLKYQDKDIEYDFTKGNWHVITATVFSESEYNSKKKDWENFKTWEKNRNPKRRESEIEFGIDCKYAYHAIRLTREGYTLLTEGKVIVKRPDAEELLQIRLGAWSFEKIVDYVKEMDFKLGEAEKISTLPYSPNLEKIEELQVELITSYLKEKSVI